MVVCAHGMPRDKSHILPKAQLSCNARGPAGRCFREAILQLGLLPTRVKEQWKSVPTYPMWHTCLIRHSRVVATAVLIAININF